MKQLEDRGLELDESTPVKDSFFESLARQIKRVNPCILHHQVAEIGKSSPDDFAAYLSNPYSIGNVLQQISNGGWKDEWERLVMSMIGQMPFNVTLLKDEEYPRHSNYDLACSESMFNFVIVKEGNRYFGTRKISASGKIY